MSVMAEPFRVTPVYDLLLHGTSTMPVGLYHLQMATAEQLCRLHYSKGSLTTVKARLKDLADHGYVQADATPVKHVNPANPTKLYFSPRYYYTLAPQGIRYLHAAGLDTSDAFRASKEANKHALFIEHTLELNDVLIAAALLNRSAPSYQLDSFIHERSLKHKPYKATWKVDTQTQSFTIIPDAFLDFHALTSDGKQRRMPLVLEHDRGTEEQQHFRRRIRAYVVLLKSGAYQELFGVRALTVAFTTFTGEARLRQMREWTKAELAGEPASLYQAFWFASLNCPLEPQQVWLEPRWWSASHDASQPVALLA